jgi:hypothetical protein
MRRFSLRTLNGVKFVKVQMTRFIALGYLTAASSNCITRDFVSIQKEDDIPTIEEILCEVQASCSSPHSLATSEISLPL